jgi:hypothetical protein
MGIWEISFKHFIVSLALFAILTAGNFDMLSKSFYSHASQGNESENAGETQVISKVSRSPASLRQTKTVEIGCSVQTKRAPQSVTQTKRFFSQESLMRLRGKTCLHGSGFQMVKISNLTNGFTAAIFAENSNEFQTDFIQLNRGLNELVFELQNKDGEKFQEILYFELNS